jgi:hypothetical protein
MKGFLILQFHFLDLQEMYIFSHENNCSYEYMQSCVAHIWRENCILLDNRCSGKKIKKRDIPSSLNFSSRIKSHYNSCSCICLSFAALSVSKLCLVVNMTDFISRNLKSREKFSYMFHSNSIFLCTG